ncbi:hypothetical protein D9M72_593860 [compost metagenome]
MIRLHPGDLLGPRVALLVSPLLQLLLDFILGRFVASRTGRVMRAKFFLRLQHVLQEAAKFGTDVVTGGNFT